MDRYRLRPRCTENSAGYLKTKWQGRGSSVENKERLPHSAAVGRRDRRTKGTEKQGGKQRMGISITNRRPHVARQRPAYAATGVETRWTAKEM